MALLLAIALHLSAGNAFCQGYPDVRLAAFNYPPFFMMEDKKVQGIAVDIGQELFRRLGLTSNVTMFPLKRVLDNLEAGSMDAVMILIQTQERSRFLEFTRPVMTVRGLIWSVDEPVSFNTLDDLREYRIGVTQGYSYGEKFDALLQTMRPDVANTDYHNYLKLRAHRIDIFPGNEIVAKGLFKQHPELRGQFVHSEKSFIKWVLRVAVSKKSDLVERLSEMNRILADMEKDGFIDEAIRKYIQ